MIESDLLDLPIEHKIKYQIVLNVFFDEYGADKETHWTINRWHKTWYGRWKWKPVTHVDCGWGDCHKTVTQFKSQEMAESFLRDLVDGQPIDEWTQTVVAEYET